MNENAKQRFKRHGNSYDDCGPASKFLKSNNRKKMETLISDCSPDPLIEIHKVYQAIKFDLEKEGLLKSIPCGIQRAVEEGIKSRITLSKLISKVAGANIIYYTYRGYYNIHSDIEFVIGVIEECKKRFKGHRSSETQDNSALPINVNEVIDEASDIITTNITKDINYFCKKPSGLRIHAVKQEVKFRIVKIIWWRNVEVAQDIVELYQKDNLSNNDASFFVKKQEMLEPHKSVWHMSELNPLGALSRKILNDIVTFHLNFRMMPTKAYAELKKVLDERIKKVVSDYGVKIDNYIAVVNAYLKRFTYRPNIPSLIDKRLCDKLIECYQEKNLQVVTTSTSHISTNMPTMTKHSDVSIPTTSGSQTSLINKNNSILAVSAHLIDELNKENNMSHLSKSIHDQLQQELRLRLELICVKRKFINYGNLDQLYRQKYTLTDDIRLRQCIIAEYNENPHNNTSEYIQSVDKDQRQNLEFKINVAYRQIITEVLRLIPTKLRNNFHVAEYKPKVVESLMLFEKEHYSSWTEFYISYRTKFDEYVDLRNMVGPALYVDILCRKVEPCLVYNNVQPNDVDLCSEGIQLKHINSDPVDSINGQTTNHPKPMSSQESLLAANASFYIIEKMQTTFLKKFSNNMKRFQCLMKRRMEKIQSCGEKLNFKQLIDRYVEEHTVEDDLLIFEEFVIARSAYNTKTISQQDWKELQDITDFEVINLLESEPFKMAEDKIVSAVYKKYPEIFQYHLIIFRCLVRGRIKGIVAENIFPQDRVYDTYRLIHNENSDEELLLEVLRGKINWFAVAKYCHTTDLQHIGEIKAHVEPFSDINRELKYIEMKKKIADILDKKLDFIMGYKTPPVEENLNQRTQEINSTIEIVKDIAISQNTEISRNHISNVLVKSEPKDFEIEISDNFSDRMKRIIETNIVKPEPVDVGVPVTETASEEQIVNTIQTPSKNVNLYVISTVSPGMCQSSELTEGTEGRNRTSLKSEEIDADIPITEAGNEKNFFYARQEPPTNGSQDMTSTELNTVSFGMHESSETSNLLNSPHLDKITEELVEKCLNKSIKKKLISLLWEDNQILSEMMGRPSQVQPCTWERLQLHGTPSLPSDEALLRFLMRFNPVSIKNNFAAYNPHVSVHVCGTDNAKELLKHNGTSLEGVQISIVKCHRQFNKGCKYLLDGLHSKPQNKQDDKFPIRNTKHNESTTGTITSFTQHLENDSDGTRTSPNNNRKTDEIDTSRNVDDEESNDEFDKIMDNFDTELGDFLHSIDGGLDV